MNLVRALLSKCAKMDKHDKISEKCWHCNNSCDNVIIYNNPKYVIYNICHDCRISLETLDLKDATEKVKYLKGHISIIKN